MSLGPQDERTLNLRTTRTQKSENQAASLTQLQQKCKF